MSNLFIRDLINLYRLTRDQKTKEFKTAPLYLVVCLNSELEAIKCRLRNPWVYLK